MITSGTKMQHKSRANTLCSILLTKHKAAQQALSKDSFLDGQRTRSDELLASFVEPFVANCMNTPTYHTQWSQSMVYVFVITCRTPLLKWRLLNSYHHHQKHQLHHTVLLYCLEQIMNADAAMTQGVMERVRSA